MTDPVTSLPNAIDHTALPEQGGQRSVAVLGATGSIGCNTLDIIAHHPDRFRIASLTANKNAEKLIEQARRFRPDYVAVVDAEAAAIVREALSGLSIEVGEGPEALVEAAERDSDIVVAGIVGAAGLPSTLAAARRGAIVALANKEALVCAGPLMTDLVRARKATLLPVDSEHNAIFQVFENHNRDALQRIILTASGGPFRAADLATMQAATPAQAVAHPTWSMGAKISVDSATMMNKGLEIIEAHFLFDLPIEQIDVVIHPQSVIHSMVEYNDGSVLAQMGTPDMRTPIAHCLGWPNRVSKPGERLDFSALNALTFEEPDHQRFPSLNMARAAISTGGTAPTILNAANEIAVAAFLDSRIGFMQIPEIVERTVAAASIEKLEALEQVFAADHWARQHAGGLIG